MNTKSAEVLYAGGFPNTVDGYQVNFRVPDDTIPGMATIRLSAAWTLGGEVKIPVR